MTSHEIINLLLLYVTTEVTDFWKHRIERSQEVGMTRSHKTITHWQKKFWKKSCVLGGTG